MARVTADLAAQLKVDAAQMTFIPDGPPTFAVSSDHKVGDAARTFTMTIRRHHRRECVFR
ncbi:MAG TPA: hypothetical protein VFD88_08910 [Clostridia bacterium]|nr:hypothetical protein [Clostridia bacterium]